MRVLIKGVEFEKFDLDGVMDFIAKSKKTQLVGIKCFQGKKHVIHSISQTLKAFRNKDNIAKTEELELLVRLSGQKQIKNALEKCRPGKKSVFISWTKDSFQKLRKEFKVREIKLKEPAIERQKQAIERTATFYLSS